MNTTPWLWRVGAILGAMALGGYWGRHSQVHREPSPAADRVPAQELRRLQAENERLKGALARSITPEAKPDSPPAFATATGSPDLQPMRVLATLQKRKMATATMTYVDREAKLAPAFIELFALTDPEQRALQQTLDSTRERLAELERQNATMSRDAKGAIIIAVKPFPEEGGAAYDSLLKSFADTLGPERNSAFVALGVEQVERALGRFGAAQRTLTFSTEPGPDGATQYRIMEAHKLPQESSNSSSQHSSYADAVKHLGTLARLLPP